MAQTETLKRTPFYDLHVAAGAKMVPFAGYEMPVQYPEGITAEHDVVRTRRRPVRRHPHGRVRDHAARTPSPSPRTSPSNDPTALAVGQVQYSCFLHETGGIVDDCLVHRLPDRMMIVVNASNCAKDWAHINRYAAQVRRAAEGPVRRDRAARAPGPEVAGGAPAAGARREPRRDQVLPLRARARWPA